MIPASHMAAALPVGLGRRLAAIFYDSLLLCAVLLIAGLPLPMIPEPAAQAWWGKLAVQAYLLSVCFAFYGWFWVHGGQTLGMRAWRLRLLRESGEAVNWRAASARFVFAIVSWLPFGLGFLWSLVDRDGRTWHDRWSGTQLVIVAKGMPASGDAPQQ